MVRKFFKRANICTLKKKHTRAIPINSLINITLKNTLLSKIGNWFHSFPKKIQRSEIWQTGYLKKNVFNLVADAH